MVFCMRKTKKNRRKGKKVNISKKNRFFVGKNNI